MSRDWTSNLPKDLRCSAADMGLKFGNYLEPEEKDFGEVRGRGETMAPTVD